MTIQIPCESYQSSFGYDNYSVTITPEIARQIVAMATTEQFSAVQPAAPALVADDEATIAAMRREIAPYSDEWENITTDLLAAIRRGEIPGVTTADENGAFKIADQFVKERDALKAENERLKAERDRAVVSRGKRTGSLQR